MQMTGQQTLPVSQADAWAALNDIAMLQAALPGCESITPSGEDGFEVLVAVSIGPVKARFKGRLQLSELKPPQSYRLGFEGSGGAAGHGKGQALVQLQGVPSGETVLSYDINASVGGKLAQIGSRLVDAAAQKVAEDFFARFKAALVERHPPVQAPAAAAAAPPPGHWRRLCAWLKRVFG